MNCPKCGLEMEHGHVSFIPMQGMDMMSMSFKGDSEKQKGLFRRKSHDIILNIGLDADAYYCSSCKLIVPLMKE